MKDIPVYTNLCLSYLVHIQVYNRQRYKHVMLLVLSYTQTHSLDINELLVLRLCRLCYIVLFIQQRMMRMRVKKKFVLVLAACATIPMCLLLYSKLGADGKNQ